MGKPLKVWSADREQKYGIVVDSFDQLKEKVSNKFGLSNFDNATFVLEEDGTHIDESYWECLKDHSKIILLQSSEQWCPDSVWPPHIKDHQKFDFVDGNNGEKMCSEKLFTKLQQNPAIMVLLNLNEMEIIKDADVNDINGKRINKILAKDLQEKCVELYLTRKKEEEALEVIEMIKKTDICSSG